SVMAMTSPEQIPHLTSSFTLCEAMRPMFSSPTLATASMAARTARRASSSWQIVAPKTAITASPMNFSTAPPCATMADFAASKYRSIICRHDSGSSISASAVDPTRSMNKIATFFLASRLPPDALIGEPHMAQNRALSAAAAWQAGHVICCRPAGTLSKPPQLLWPDPVTVGTTHARARGQAIPTLSRYLTIHTMRRRHELPRSGAGLVLPNVANGTVVVKSYPALARRTEGFVGLLAVT